MVRIAERFNLCISHRNRSKRKIRYDDFCTKLTGKHSARRSKRIVIQSVDFVKIQRCPYRTQSRFSEHNVSEKGAVIVVTDVILILNKIYQRENIPYLKPLRPHNGRAEVKVKIFVVKFNHIEGKSILKQRVIFNSVRPA